MRLLMIFSLLFLIQGLNAQNTAIVAYKSLIFPVQHEHVHGSSLVQLPDGDLISAWFQGSGERTADDVRIMASKFSQKTKVWSSPYLLADTEGLPDCNPVLYLDGGKLFLVWIAVQANRWEYSILKIKSTTDFKGEKVSWQWQDNILLKPGEEFVKEVREKFKQLPNLGRGWAEYAPRYDDMIIAASDDAMKRSFGWMTRIKPLILEDGKILLPVYSDGLNFSMIAISQDNSSTWKNSMPIVGRGNIQPTLITKQNGDIVAYMRDTGDAPSRMHKSISKDKGQTWSVSEKTDMPSSASIDMVKLDDGRWLLIVNDTDSERYKLSLYQSNDEGESWKLVHNLVNDNGGRGRYSYPAMIVGQDGKVHLTYSHHLSGQEKSIIYTVIEPDKIKH